MKLTICSDIELEGPSEEGGDGSGYVTWLDVKVTEKREEHGTARVGILHVGEVADAHGDLWPAVHATPLENIHNVYFSQGWYRDEYADGAGIDLLYISSVDIDEARRSKNLDLAVVRRLCDTFGSGCQLAVMPYRDAHEAAHWSRLGFVVSTPGRTSGLMHMKLGFRTARIVDATGAGDFEVLGSELPAPRTQAN